MVRVSASSQDNEKMDAWQEQFGGGKVFRGRKKCRKNGLCIFSRTHALLGNARPDALRPVPRGVATLTSSLFAHRLAQVHIAAEPIPHRFHLGTISQKAPMAAGPPRGGWAEVVASFIRGIEGWSR